MSEDGKLGNGSQLIVFKAALVFDQARSREANAALGLHEDSANVWILKASHLPLFLCLDQFETGEGEAGLSGLVAAYIAIPSSRRSHGPCSQVLGSG